MDSQGESIKRQTTKIEQGEHHLLLTYDSQFKPVKYIINKLQPILDNGTLLSQALEWQTQACILTSARPKAVSHKQQETTEQ